MFLVDLQPQCCRWRPQHSACNSKAGGIPVVELLQVVDQPCAGDTQVAGCLMQRRCLPRTARIAIQRVRNVIVPRECLQR